MMELDLNAAYQHLQRLAGVVSILDYQDVARDRW